MLLNPLKHLKGKLNHLHLTNTHILRPIHIASMISPSASESSSLDNESPESILSLKASESFSERQYHKFEFDYMIHFNQGNQVTTSTIFDDLSPHEKKMSYLVSNFTSKLTARQILYLNYAVRKQIDSEYPTWTNLHINKLSPSKADIEILPTLTSVQRIPQLKSFKKKLVMKHIKKAKQQMP